MTTTTRRAASSTYGASLLLKKDQERFLASGGKSSLLSRSPGAEHLAPVQVREPSSSSSVLDGPSSVSRHARRSTNESMGVPQMHHRSSSQGASTTGRTMSGAFDTSTLRHSLSTVASDTDSPMSASGYRPATKARKVEEATSSYRSRTESIRRTQSIPENPPSWRRTAADASSTLTASGLRLNAATRYQDSMETSTSHASAHSLSAAPRSPGYTSRTASAYSQNAAPTQSYYSTRSRLPELQPVTDAVTSRESVRGRPAATSYHRVSTSSDSSSSEEDSDVEESTTPSSKASAASKSPPWSPQTTYMASYQQPTSPAIASPASADTRIPALRSPTYRRDLSGRLQRDVDVREDSSRVSDNSFLTEQRPAMRSPVKLPLGKGVVGLQNLGNTCYLNSILQCLNAVPELVQYFLQGKGAVTSGAKVAAAYAALVLKMWQAQSDDVVSPSRFISQLTSWDRRWGNGRQHDAQEFLHSLLEALQVELNRNPERPAYKELSGKGSEAEQADEAWQYALALHSSIIDEVFGGQLQSTLECHHCHTKSHCFDYFVDLSLPVPQGRKQVTIQDCLDAFTEVEEMEEEEGYRCGHCKCCRPATKKLTIHRCPGLLVLHLKRFSQSGSGFLGRFSSLSKNSTPVELKADGLDLSSYCSTWARKHALPPIYDLVAISHHSGSLGGGHYTAQCRAAGDGRWLDFNDSFVSDHADPQGSSSSAYILFYRQRGL